MPDGSFNLEFEIAKSVDSMVKSVPAGLSDFKSLIGAFIHPNRGNVAPAAEEFLAMRERQMNRANAIAKAFRANTRMAQFPTLRELAKAGIPLAKAELDVGTLTNFAQITGGQSLGYVSLDTQLARGTVRPNSFTLYQALAKTRAFQVVDYWGYASDTGGALPGAAFSAYSGVGSGTLNTSAGKYQLQNINLQLAVDGRAMTTALAAQNSFVDVAAQETTNAALVILQSLDWASYWGNPTFFPNQFKGLANVIPTGNVLDWQVWNNANASAGWSSAQSLFNAIYEWSAQITSFNQFGRVTHAFMSPQCAGNLQQLSTTLLNNIVNKLSSLSDVEGIVINGDLQGMKTRFGEIQFPIDLFITARDKPALAIIYGDGTTGVTTGISAPTSVTVAASGAALANSAWTAAYVATSGIYTYAVASCDASMNESTLTYSSPISGIAQGRAYTLTIAQPDTTMVAFRVYRSGLGFTTTASGTGPYAQNPAAYRYIGTVAASGASGNVTFVDSNSYIPGSDTIFLLDLDERDMALDFRYLLPLTKIDLFAQNLFMPWAVAAIGAVRARIPKFHGFIKNFVSDNADWNPLSPNANSV